MERGRFWIVLATGGFAGACAVIQAAEGNASAIPNTTIDGPIRNAFMATSGGRDGNEMIRVVRQLSLLLNDLSQAAPVLPPFANTSNGLT